MDRSWVFLAGYPLPQNSQVLGAQLARIGRAAQLNVKRLARFGEPRAVHVA